MCISCLLNIILAPNNITWIRLNYVLSTGPLAIASIAWRNSLVFHSLDKVTSTLIHVFPPVLMYNVRWFPIGIDEDHDAKISNYLGFNVSTMLGSTQLSRMCETSDVPKGPGGRIDANMFYFYHYDVAPPCTSGITYFEIFYNGLLAYAFWQISYLAITEVFHAGFLNREAGYQTSLRWLAVDTRNSMNRITYASCRYLGVFKAGETFDPSTIKTKSIFVVAQFVFTCVCLLPIKLMYSSWITNFVFLTFVFCVILWNGASYYFNVFTVRYEKELPGEVGANNAEALDPDVLPETTLVVTANTAGTGSKDAKSNKKTNKSVGRSKSRGRRKKS